MSYKPQLLIGNLRIFNKLTMFVLTLLFLTSCSSKLKKETLVSVTGKIPSEKMGTTLIHEHILVDFIGADSTGYHRWEKPEVIKKVLPFLMEAKQRGVHTLFECTPSYLGRDPLLLKELAEKSGINIVTNTGYYGARDNKFIPKQAFSQSAEEIAKVWIDEFKNGIEGSGVIPGFIKISVDRNDIFSPMHTKIIKAAAITHKTTGLTIVSHTGTDGPAFAQLEVLKNEGVSPEAFVWTHAQDGTFAGYLKAAKQGAWISLDNLNRNNTGKPGGIVWFVELLTKLKNENLLNKILISHDAGWYDPDKVNGGNFRGYTDMFDHLIPALKTRGFTQQDIDLLLINNPKKAYAVKIRLNKK